MTVESETGVSAAQTAHKWLVEDTDLFSNVIEKAGQYDAKLDVTANSSLAAHILNAVTVGVNTFIYQAVGPEESVNEYETEIKVLAAALVLHDVNKYVREAYGYDADGNTTEAFERYFENDDFGIEEFLDGNYRNDLHYIVQNTEIYEDSSETRGIKTDFRGLERYARIGDQVASVALRGGINGAYRKLSEKINCSEIHLLEFTELEQPVLNDLILGSAKEVIAGDVDGINRGVIIGSSSAGILYLGREVNRDKLRDMTATQVAKRIERYDFSCKLTWNSFDYDILDELSLPLSLKKKIIIEQASELLTTDSGSTEPVESIPSGFKQYIPFLIKSIYQDGRDEYFTDDLTERYRTVYESIEGSKSAKGQKVKLEFLQHLCVNYHQVKEDLKVLRNEVESGLKADLEAEGDAIDQVVHRFFEGQELPVLGSKDRMCFLCGAETDTKYQKGPSGIYRTQEFSRRVPPHAKYKSICEVCNLEYALLADICDRSDVHTNNDLEVAYFYFDDFLGDVRVRTRRAGNIVQGDSDELDDREVNRSLVGPQYYIQPIYVLNKNHRMKVIRQAMQAAQESGMKVAVGRPFTRFESADAVFTDQEATRPQELLNLDDIERFGPLPDFAAETNHSHLRRALSLFKIMSIVGKEAGLSNRYIHLDRDTFHSIAHFAVTNHGRASHIDDELRSYFEKYHRGAFMNMKTVAERGIDLFGEQYDSKYKKTKIFREGIDAFLSGMNQGMNDEQLVEYVESQVYAAADREDYAGYVDPDEAEAFVEAIHTYLMENQLYDLKKLSDWEDALVNSYYYAYDQVLK